jgi:uracil-DNA glycosylase
MPRLRAILALGTLAHAAVLRARGLRLSGYKFAHGALHALPGGLALADSYHVSRYNTSTRRLTAEMFGAVIERLREELAPA